MLTALGSAEATLFSEALNHASLIDGTWLARAAVQRYPHGDLAALDALLGACTSPLKLRSSPTACSAWTATSPRWPACWRWPNGMMPGSSSTTRTASALGAQGRGVLAHLGLASERFVYIGTLGKAAGVAGAFVAAHPLVIEHLVNAARPYIYTTAAPPAVAHALLASLDLIAGAEGDARRAALAERIAELRAGLAPLAAAAGWQLPPSDTAIQPLIIGDNDEALALSAALEADGIRVGAIRPPTVAAGTARLRITLSAAHSAGRGYPAGGARPPCARRRRGTGTGGRMNASLPAALRPPSLACFVTGTDTGVGKTHASATLLHALRARRLPRRRHEAGRQRQRMARRRLAQRRRGPVARRRLGRGRAARDLPFLRTPCSPHLAAAA